MARAVVRQDKDRDYGKDDDRGYDKGSEQKNES